VTPHITTTYTTISVALHASVEIMTILALFLAASGIWPNDRMCLY